MLDYIPERGDAVRLPFDPRAGYEQAGRRPVLNGRPPSGVVFKVVGKPHMLLPYPGICDRHR